MQNAHTDHNKLHKIRADRLILRFVCFVHSKVGWHWFRLLTDDDSVFTECILKAEPFSGRLGEPSVAGHYRLIRLPPAPRTNTDTKARIQPSLYTYSMFLLHFALYFIIYVHRTFYTTSPSFVERHTRPRDVLSPVRRLPLYRFRQ